MASPLLCVLLYLLRHLATCHAATARDTITPGSPLAANETLVSGGEGNFALGFFTPPDDPGNHSHVQVNNADTPGYRDDALKGAYKVKQ